ncbi:MAG: 4-alpha-glucanotransferase [Sideroxyarcus sp.]|nr:4-alpha-glucanotransferase [Sideroxyarcus sp.]
MSALPTSTSQPDPDLLEALRLLDKTEFLLAVHDTSFPSPAGEDSGCGSPYGKGGLALAEFARSLGFTGLQLGPQGLTTPGNPSPYDGTLFSRSILSLDLQSLMRSAWGELLSEDSVREMVEGNPHPEGGKVNFAYAHDAYRKAAEEIYCRFEAARLQGKPGAVRLAGSLAEFWDSNKWVRDDAAYEAMCSGQRASAADSKHGNVQERYSLLQFILLEQHRTFRDNMRELGIKVYGDAQVGFSQRDAWSRKSLLLDGYFLGAPPSRTNTLGQPWNYQVLNPSLYLGADGGPGPVLDFVAERIGKMLEEFDGVRMDHPHGLVCPWVYRANDPDPFRAVQNGARLFAAPDLPDHPELSRYAIVRPDQVNRHRPRYAEDWEHSLTAEQEHIYALIMDTIVGRMNAHGRRKEDILFEVLSTEPMPLRQVRQRHGLGRFRVTQKANLDDSADVYRGENAEPRDWIMLGNHDTPSIWGLVRDWHGSEEGFKQAGYLARRLRPDSPEQLSRILAADQYKLAHAKMAELFLSPAQHVMMFFADLFGIEETYNVPGTQNEENWTLRVPNDFLRIHELKKREGRALNLHAVLALALRARPDICRPELIARLEAKAGWTIDRTVSPPASSPA